MRRSVGLGLCLLVAAFGCSTSHLNTDVDGGSSGASGSSGLAGRGGERPGGNGAGNGGRGGRDIGGSGGGFGATGGSGGGVMCGVPSRVPDECVVCSAERDPSATAMCDATCIDLLECAAGAACQDAACLQQCCGNYLGGLNGLLAVYGQDGMGPLATCIDDNCPTDDTDGGI